MKLRKLTALFLTAITAATLSISASAGYVKEGTTPLIDIKPSVKGELRRENPDGTGRAFLYNEKCGIITGKSIAYLDMSDSNALGFDMRMYCFDKETGQFLAKPYTGFTKDSKGRRYYYNGERVIGWFNVGNSWYHFGKNGYADTGKVKIGGAKYTFDDKGRWTGKVSKSGLAPKDFSLSIAGSLGGKGFSTDGVLCYGEKEAGGKYNVDIKLSKRDKQVFWSICEENGIEELNGISVNDSYISKNIMNSDYLKDAPDELEMAGECDPSVTYAVKVTANGKKITVEYEPEAADQLIHFDETAYKINNITSNIYNYYQSILCVKYPRDESIEMALYC